MFGWAGPVLSRRRRAAVRAVAPRQREHLPAKPAWDCVGCGKRFPCPSYKQLVWDTNAGDREQIAAVMAGWMGLARREILLSAAEHHTRFIEWIYRWPT